MPNLPSEEIFCSLFEPAEKPEAVRRLVELVHEQGDHTDVGIVGVQVLFHELSEGGYGELSYERIVRSEFPSYRQWLESDATTLREWVWPEDRDSLNHHFRGDISYRLIRRLEGIRFNLRRNGKELDIKPGFTKQLDYVSGRHLAPEGKISVSWTRTKDGVLPEVEAPAGLSGRIILPCGYVFASDGMAYRSLYSGSYPARKANNETNKTPQQKSWPQIVRIVQRSAERGKTLNSASSLMPFCLQMLPCDVLPSV